MVLDGLSIGGRHTVPFQLTGINALITFFAHRFLIPQVNQVAVGIAKFNAVPPDKLLRGFVENHAVRGSSRYFASTSGT